MSDIPEQCSDVSALDVWLSFDDLRRARIVSSWKTLREWQLDPRIGFPLGRLLAPNTRRWSKHHEIDPFATMVRVEVKRFDGLGYPQRRRLILEIARRAPFMANGVSLRRFVNAPFGVVKIDREGGVICEQDITVAVLNAWFGRGRRIVH